MDLFDQFLDNAYLPLYGLTVIAALWRYPRYFDTPFKFFPVLLMYTFLTELLGSLIYTYEVVPGLIVSEELYNNWIVYNIYNIVFFLYFFYIYRKYLISPSDKTLVKYGGILYLLASIINPFFQDFTISPQLYAYIIGGGVLVICTILYGRQLKKNTGKWFSPNSFLSWLSLGMFVFYPGYILIKIWRQVYLEPGVPEDPLIRRFHLLLILFMYGCFLLGFVRMRRKSI